MPPQKKDVYAQKMRLAVTMSAANTLTFAQVSIGMSLFDYAAMLINRIEYYASAAALQECVAATDRLDFAITGSNSLTSLDVSLAEVYDMVQVLTYISGAPAVSAPFIIPIVRDFTNMAGNGLLVPAQDFFVAMNSAGMASAHSLTVIIYYTIKSMSSNDYLELVQRLRVLST